jgi:SAM-dependent methyltransferase
MPMFENISCPVCGGTCALLDELAFDPQRQPGLRVRYVMCQRCGFSHAPEIAAWTPAQFREKIYNDDYVTLDPEYLEVRPRSSADTLLATFGDRGRAIRHLDYGGGGGLVSRLLNEAGWRSTSYDPFVNPETRIADLGRFDLITAFEVFEHVPDVNGLIHNLHALLAPGGMVIFTTLLSDGKLRPGEHITWDYVAPRNGHISLYSSASLALLAHHYGWNFASFSELIHTFFTDVPEWASHLIRAPEERPGG